MFGSGNNAGGYPGGPPAGGFPGGAPAGGFPGGPPAGGFPGGPPAGGFPGGQPGGGFPGGAQPGGGFPGGAPGGFPGGAQPGGGFPGGAQPGGGFPGGQPGGGFPGGAQPGGGFPGGAPGGFPGGAQPGGGFPGGAPGGGFQEQQKGGFPGGQPGGQFPGCGPGGMWGTGPGSNSLATGGQSIINPRVPYSGRIPGGMTDNKTFTIKGKVLNRAQRFCINFVVSSSEDMPFHFNPRFTEGAVIRNTRREGCWDIEEKDLRTHYPFREGQSFDLSIRCESQKFSVTVNGQHLCDYKHHMSYNQIDTLQIEGDVEVSYLQL